MNIKVAMLTVMTMTMRGRLSWLARGPMKGRLHQIQKARMATTRGIPRLGTTVLENRADEQAGEEDEPMGAAGGRGFPIGPALKGLAEIGHRALRAGALILSALVSFFGILYSNGALAFLSGVDPAKGDDTTVARQAYLYSSQVTTIMVLILVVAGVLFSLGRYGTKLPLRIVSGLFFVGAVGSFVATLV